MIRIIIVNDIKLFEMKLKFVLINYQEELIMFLIIISDNLFACPTLSKTENTRLLHLYTSPRPIITKSVIIHIYNHHDRDHDQIIVDDLTIYVTDRPRSVF